MTPTEPLDLDDTEAALMLVVPASMHNAIAALIVAARQLNAVTAERDSLKVDLEVMQNGLRIAREIASKQYGWNVSVWLDMTKKDMTRLMAEAIVEAIDARIKEATP